MKFAASDPIAVLNATEQARVAIADHFDDLVAQCDAYVEREREASQQFLQTYSLDDLRDFIVAKSHVGAAKEIAQLLRYQLQAEDLVGSKFRNEHPKFRALLIAAAEH